MADVSKLQDGDGNEYSLVDAGAVHTVDSALTDSSTNPVQNKVLNTALNGKVPTSRTINKKALTSNVELFRHEIKPDKHYAGGSKLVKVASITRNFGGNSSFSVQIDAHQYGADFHRQAILNGDVYCNSSGTAKVTQMYCTQIYSLVTKVYYTYTTSSTQYSLNIYINALPSNSWSVNVTPLIASTDSDRNNWDFTVAFVEKADDFVEVPFQNRLLTNNLPLSKVYIYGCRVKRAKTGGNWFDNNGFQIVESYASSFRTHWITFRWSSAAQMNGTTNLGCRRFLFGYEETGRFLRCFVSEDDSYWYVWILFMNAKTGGALGLNACSVMEMQTVPNGLEVLTTAPDLTTLTEIPWAADERYAPKSHTHAGTDVTSAVNYSKMQEAELLDNTKDIVTEIKKINTRCVKWYCWNETSRPTNAPTNSARSLMQAIVQYENGIRITLVAYPQDTSEYYYIAHYAGTAATTITWRTVYTVPTSTYSATGTQAVNGTAVASAISGKQDKLTQGPNITISGNTISATDTKYDVPDNTTLDSITNSLVNL